MADAISMSKGPEKIGKYRVLSTIASGGMGTVYLASAQEDGADRVALKVLHPHLAQDESVASRFMVEGQLGARIAHPNVVGVLEAGQADGVTYLAMEYVDGPTLGRLLHVSSKRSREVPLPIAVSVVLDLLAGLHAAHEAVDDQGAPLGAVHRDVSPQNILVDREGRALITDFGIAKLQDSLRQTRAGSVVGKAGYMAPEQILGADITARTDLYAVGIILWEAFTCARLFSGFEDQIQAVVKQRPVPPLAERRADLPAELIALVEQLLSQDPALRPGSAFDVSNRLRALSPRASRSEVAAWVADLRTEPRSHVPPEVRPRKTPSVLPAPTPPPRKLPKLSAEPHVEEDETRLVRSSFTSAVPLGDDPSFTEVEPRRKENGPTPADEVDDEEETHSLERLAPMAFADRATIPDLDGSLREAALEVTKIDIVPHAASHQATSGAGAPATPAADASATTAPVVRPSPAARTVMIPRQRQGGAGRLILVLVLVLAIVAAAAYVAMRMGWLPPLATL